MTTATADVCSATRTAHVPHDVTIGELLNMFSLLKEEEQRSGSLNRVWLHIRLNRVLHVEWSSCGLYLKLGRRDWFWSA